MQQIVCFDMMMAWHRTMVIAPSFGLTCKTTYALWHTEKKYHYLEYVMALDTTVGKFMSHTVRNPNNTAIDGDDGEDEYGVLLHNFGGHDLTLVPPETEYTYRHYRSTRDETPVYELQMHVTEDDTHVRYTKYDPFADVSVEVGAIELLDFSMEMWNETIADTHTWFRSFVDTTIEKLDHYVLRIKTADRTRVFACRGLKVFSTKTEFVDVPRILTYLASTDINICNM